MTSLRKRARYPLGLTATSLFFIDMLTAQPGRWKPRENAECRSNSKALGLLPHPAFRGCVTGAAVSWLDVGVRTNSRGRSARDFDVRRSGESVSEGTEHCWERRPDCPTLDRKWWNQRHNQRLQSPYIQQQLSSPGPLVFQCAFACEVFLKNAA